MKKIILSFLILVLVTAFVGCSSTKPPKDFDEELWKDSVEISKLVYEKYNKGIQLSDNEMNKLKQYENKYDEYDNKWNDNESNVIMIIGSFRSNLNGYFSYKDNPKASHLMEKYEILLENCFNELKNINKSLIK